MKIKVGSAAINTTPIELEGRPCLVGFFNDITERKGMEAQLRQQQKLATIGTLARGMAHEIKTPSTGL